VFKFDSEHSSIISSLIIGTAKLKGAPQSILNCVISKCMPVSHVCSLEDIKTSSNED